MIVYPQVSKRCASVTRLQKVINCAMQCKYSHIMPAGPSFYSPSECVDTIRVDIMLPNQLHLERLRELVRGIDPGFGNNKGARLYQVFLVDIADHRGF